MKFGEKIKEFRSRNKVSLREYCVKNNIDPIKQSRMERGIYPPPESKEKLKDIADSLMVFDEEREEFFELAKKDRENFIPPKVSDEELVKHLPLFFCGQNKLSKKKLVEFAEYIRADLEGREVKI